MAKSKEEPTLANNALDIQIESPALCGTMLLYAGVIRLEVRDVESAPTPAEEDVPKFI